MRPGRSGREAGSATVLVLALAAVLAVVGTVAAAIGAVAVTRHRAAAVADLAALAAADRAPAGQAVGCDAARRVAEAGSATLVSCRLTGEVVDVVVTVRPPGALGSWGLARSHSRAGPSGR